MTWQHNKDIDRYDVKLFVPDYSHFNNGDDDVPIEGTMTS